MREAEPADTDGQRPEREIEELLSQRETVFLVCLGFVRNRHDAEELAQETYLRAWRERGRRRGEGSVRAWLCRIARNACLDHLRRSRKGLFRRLLPTTDPPDATDLAAELEEKEGLAALRRAVASLSRPLRDVLVLREYGELSYEQIAGTLGVSPGTVMSRLHRARARVAEAVREPGAGR